MSRTRPDIPLSIRFLRWFCDPDLLEDVEGDLEELQATSEKTDGQKSRALWLEVLRLFRPGIIRNFHFETQNNTTAMVKNYLISSWRHLMKHKHFALINITSLSIGIVVCLVIYLFIQDELSFDRFHSKAFSIYRLGEIQSFPGTNTQRVPLSMPGMGPTLTAEFPEIKSFTRYWNLEKQMVQYQDKKIMVKNVAATDSTFFELFDFQLQAGDSHKVLALPNSAVITEDVAMRLFNRNDVINETIQIGENHATITGVMATIPENSHLQFDILLSIRTMTRNNPGFDSEFSYNFLNTYLLFHDQADVRKVENNLKEYLAKYLWVDHDINAYELFIQPLKEVHLASMSMEHDNNNHRKFNGEYLDVFLTIAIFIIVIASLNFMNLSTARTGSRAREVGVRKTIGATSRILFYQFIVESILLSIFALIVAISILILILPILNVAFDRNLSWIYLLDAKTLFAIIAGTVALGVVAGMYPSLYLSSFRPALILKGVRNIEKKSKFNNALVIVQFGLAIGMIITTLIVLQQLTYLNDKDIGLDKDHIVLLEMSEESNEKYDALKEAMLENSNVLGVTASNQSLGSNMHQWGFKLEKDSSIISIVPSNIYVDFDYLDVYDIQILEGRGLSREYATDEQKGFLVNQAFVEAFGLEYPLGSKLGFDWYPNDSLGNIVGIINNFNFNSLHVSVNPLVMEVNPGWGYLEMSIKINGNNIDEALQQIESTYNQFVSKYPLNYTFLDSQYESLYKSDRQMGSIIAIIALLSILIGAMGLLALVSIDVQRRIKEIGIRKTMGASTGQIITFLTRDFVLLIAIASVVATPFTLLYLSDWLDGFAYRISINPLIFVIGSLVALAIAMLTISFHVLRAAKSNPIDSLRYE